MKKGDILLIAPPEVKQHPGYYWILAHKHRSQPIWYCVIMDDRTEMAHTDPLVTTDKNTYIARPLVGTWIHEKDMTPEKGVHHVDNLKDTGKMSKCMPLGLMPNGLNIALGLNQEVEPEGYPEHIADLMQWEAIVTEAMQYDGNDREIRLEQMAEHYWAN